jgi:hypothetical protein
MGQLMISLAKSAAYISVPECGNDKVMEIVMGRRVQNS